MPQGPRAANAPPGNSRAYSAASARHAHAREKRTLTDAAARYATGAGLRLDLLAARRAASLVGSPLHPRLHCRVLRGVLLRTSTPQHDSASHRLRSTDSASHRLRISDSASLRLRITDYQHAESQHAGSSARRLRTAPTPPRHDLALPRLRHGTTSHFPDPPLHDSASPTPTLHDSASPTRTTTHITPTPHLADKPRQHYRVHYRVKHYRVHHAEYSTTEYTTAEYITAGTSLPVHHCRVHPVPAPPLPAS